MKITAGHPARGEKFYQRDNIITKVWELITTGHNILITAPRRVGKTSIMFYLLDNPKKGHEAVFLNTESVNDTNEFFKRLANALLKTDSVNTSIKLKNLLSEKFPAIKKIGTSGIEFGAKQELDYFEIVKSILNSANPEGNTILILLDEFPQTLENIILDCGEKEGRRFLQLNRELRQNNEAPEKTRFIYTGSIGLESVVHRINETKAINDLARLPVPPLKNKEANTLLSLLLRSSDIKMKDEIVAYMLERIKWLIPFYIQLMAQGIRDLVADEGIGEIDNKTIDKVIDNMLYQRNHFDHWHSRLRIAFKGDEYSLAKDILNKISETEPLHSNEIVDSAVKYNLMERYQDIVGSLVYDGYINNSEDKGKYRFNSPILRLWWRQNVAG